MTIVSKRTKTSGGRYDPGTLFSAEIAGLDVTFYHGEAIQEVGVERAVLCRGVWDIDHVRLIDNPEGGGGRALRNLADLLEVYFVTGFPPTKPQPLKRADYLPGQGG